MFSGGISGGSGGNTPEIASGPYALNGFNSAGSPQFSALQIDAGASVRTDLSDILTNVTLINDGTLP